MTLNNTGQIIRWLEDKFYAEHFSIYNLEDKEDLWERVSKMSDSQYEYIRDLLSKKHWFKIKEILSRYLLTK